MVQNLNRTHADLVNGLPALLASKVHVLADIPELQATEWDSRYGPPAAIILQSNHNAGDGGGIFRLLEGDTSSPDDDAMIVADLDGYRWGRVSDGYYTSAKWWPALGNSTNDTAALNQFLTYLKSNGGRGFLPRGTYVTTSELLVDETDITSDSDTTRIILEGEGDGASVIYSQHSGNAFRYLGGAGGGLGAYMQFNSLRFRGSGITNSVGMLIDNAAWFTVNDVTIMDFDYGVDGYDVLSAKFDSVRQRFNNRAERYQYSNVSRPNAILKLNCTVGSNYIYGSNVIGGAGFVVVGGAYEGNGQNAGVPNVNGFGIKVNDAGFEGSLGLAMFGSYIEFNAQIADVWIVQSTKNAAHAVVASSLSRIDSTAYTTNNILFDDNAGNSTLLVAGSGFGALNTYVENASRVFIDSTVANKVTEIGNMLGTATTARPAASDTRGPWAGSVAAAGSADKLPKGWSSVKNSTGNYTVTHNLGLTASDYAVSAVSKAGTALRVERVVPGANSFDVVTVNTSDAAADCAFMFTMMQI